MTEICGDITVCGSTFHIGKIIISQSTDNIRFIVYAEIDNPKIRAEKNVEFSEYTGKDEIEHYLKIKQAHCIQDIFVKLLDEKMGI